MARLRTARCAVETEERDTAVKHTQERTHNATGSSLGAKVKQLLRKGSQLYHAWSQYLAWFSARAAASIRRFSVKAAQTAELVGWAPTAVVGALLGATLSSAAVTWLLFSFLLDSSTRTAQVLVIGSFILALVMLLVWFASRPRVSTAVRRFWVFVKLVVVVMGLAALGIALNEAIDYF